MSKIGIGISADLDTSAVEQKVNALGQKIAQANQSDFKPVSVKTLQDLDQAIKRFEQLLRVNGELRRRMKDTGQSGKGPWELDYQSMYPDPNSMNRQMRRVFEYTFGQAFTTKPNTTPGDAPGGQGGPTPAPPPPRPGDGSLPGTAARVAQAGLSAAGPAGGVAANAIGAGMRGGFGAGMMGLLGGMAALGVSKVVGGVMEALDKAQENAIALDTLKRKLGDVNVSFGALQSVVSAGADNLKITYAEAGKLATTFAKLGNVGTEDYKTLAEEIQISGGTAKAFGLEKEQVTNVMGQMRGVGVTTSVQESRRFAMLIGETIGRSGAFAKADEVMDAIAGYAASQTRQNMAAADASGYAGMFAGMVGSGIPGMDPQGAAALLARVNSSLSAGGAKGEASRFFTGEIGADLGLDPIQTRILQEGGAFATPDKMFGEGSAAKRFGISGPDMGEGGGKTLLQMTLDKLRAKYGNDSKMLADATANHLGVGINQAMSLLSIEPAQIGDMQKRFGDLSKFNASGLGNMAKSLYGTDAERASIAQSLMTRKDVSQEDKSTIDKAMKSGNQDEIKNVLSRLSAQYGQESTQGSDIRDSRNSLDNIKTKLAGELIPAVNAMRMGIMHIAGDGKKSPAEIMADVMKLESKDREQAIKAQTTSRVASAWDEAGKARKEHREVFDDLRKNGRNMPEEERAAKQKRLGELWEAIARKEEEARKAVIQLRKDEAEAIEAERKELEKRLAAGKKAATVDMVPPPEAEKKEEDTKPTTINNTTTVVQGGAPAAAGASPGVGRAPLGDASYQPGGGAVPKNKQEAINQSMKFFMGKGWTKEQAAGITANLMAESSMNPGAVGDGGRAFGIAQWHPDRQANFARWAGKDIRQSTFEEQLGFVHFEKTQGKEKAAGDRLRESTTPEQAGSVVSQYYERPADRFGEANKRAGMAARIAAGYQEKPVVVAEKPAPSLPMPKAFKEVAQADPTSPFVATKPSLPAGSASADTALPVTATGAGAAPTQAKAPPSPFGTLATATAAAQRTPQAPVPTATPIEVPATPRAAETTGATPIAARDAARMGSSAPALAPPQQQSQGPLEIAVKLDLSPAASRLLKAPEQPIKTAVQSGWGR